jgi:hypothetical protein
MRLTAGDELYREILLVPLRGCATYKPAFGLQGGEGIDLARFQDLYGADPLYRWIGLDSDLMYAAHKAAGGMTSIYRQLGIGCERLLRHIVQDCMDLTDEQTAWSYQYDKGDGGQGTHTLDLHIRAQDIRSLQIRERFMLWVRISAEGIGVPAERAVQLEGAAFEIRQGYKSADSKRQNADLRFGMRAYIDANLLPVIAIVSTQASDVVCRRYSDARLLVLRGTLIGAASTFEFYKHVVGYDLADFFSRNTDVLRVEFERIIERLLTP